MLELARQSLQSYHSSRCPCIRHNSNFISAYLYLQHTSMSCLRHPACQQYACALPHACDTNAHANNTTILLWCICMHVVLAIHYNLMLHSQLHLNSTVFVIKNNFITTYKKKKGYRSTKISLLHPLPPPPHSPMSPFFQFPIHTSLNSPIYSFF